VLDGLVLGGLVLAGPLLAWPRWRTAAIEAEFPSEPQPAAATLTPIAAATIIRTVDLMGIISQSAHTRHSLGYVA